MSAIRWTDESEAGLLGWAASRVALLWPGQRKPNAPQSAGSPACFATVFQAPLKRRSDFQKAAELALPQLMPVSPGELMIFGRRAESGIELAAFRKHDLETWRRSADARRSGGTITISESWTIRSPAHSTGVARQRFALLGAAAFAIAVLAGSNFLYMRSLDRQLVSLLAAEQGARAAALTVARHQEDRDLWGVLEASHASKALPSAALAGIAELSRAMPDGAVWTRLDWSPAVTTVAGNAADPVAVLKAYAGLKDARAQFSKPVTRSGSGKQEFEIAINRGEAQR